MRTKVLTGLSLTLFVVTGVVMAGSIREDDNVTRTAQRSARASVVRSAARSSQTASREQMYKELLAKRTEAHKAEMKGLEDIKKLAVEENAAKTVAALQKMIDKKNAEFEKNMERYEVTRRSRASQVKAREKVKNTDGGKTADAAGND